MVTGPGEVLTLIRSGGALTRADLVEATGLSRMTVSSRVDSLLRAGLIVEGEAERSIRGRRPRGLVFNLSRSVVLVASADTTHTATAVADLSGRVLAADVVAVPIDAGPAATLDAIGEAFHRLLGGVRRGVGEVAGIGISVPGPVDPQTGRPSQPPIMPGWDGYPITEHLTSRLPSVPVHVANDADAAALGEYAAVYPGVASLVFVKVSTGIGSGMVLNGRVYLGADGGAGDIGHVRRSPLRSSTPAVCRCGATGCLAAIASGGALARELTALGAPAESGLDVGRLVAEGEPDAARLVRDAGVEIGQVLATVVGVVNPAVVVIGGALASAPLIAGIRQSLYSVAHPRATRHLRLELTRLGDDAAVRGLTALVVDNEFSAAAVNARFAGS